MDGILMSAHSLASAEADGDLTEADFRMVSDIIHREAGIVVRQHKQAMVRGRLARRARELGLASVQDYCRLLKGPELAKELPGLMNALTTNHTAFYREDHHFEHLQKTALPAVANQQKLRIWCAAASSGEEPYTIAATLHAYFNGHPHRDCLILATDLDSEVLRTAEQGCYPPSSTEKLSADQRARLMLRPTADGNAAVAPSLKAMLRFRQLNILHDWPFQGPFQVIFCRNMLIYFDQPTKADVINRMVAKLAPGGFLYLGHSEALPQAVHGLRACGRTVYAKA
jgi:chemotaxis protein methyltransferase CheR